MSGEYVETPYVDSTGFNPDDPRHPRWVWPVEPEDRTTGELEEELLARGIPFETVGGADSHTLLIGHFYVQRWPGVDGRYGFGTAPQYAHRSDWGPRHELPWLLPRLLVWDVLGS